VTQLAVEGHMRCRRTMLSRRMRSPTPHHQLVTQSSIRPARTRASQ
jgi:hypothetical protein